MPVTQKQIAQSLGVSHQLVSYALNGGGSISQERRREVLLAAREMGYRRNELARAMVTGKSRILGLLSYGESGEHIATIIAGALDEAARAGYAVKVLHVPFLSSLAEISEIAHRCSAWQLDGAVAVSLKSDAVRLFADELGRIGCPVAYVENFNAEGDIVVRTDDRSAFRVAVSHLRELGHRRIVHIPGPDHPLTSARNAIFGETLREFGLPFDAISLIPSHPTLWDDRESIERATHRMLGQNPRPTAVICAGDAAAMIVMRAAQQNGCRVPEELSVIGFGNFGLGAHAYPPLTSIAQPFREMGRLTVQRLLEHLSVTATSSATATATATSSAAYNEAGAAHPATASNLALSAERDPDELPAHLVVRESTSSPEG